MNLKVGRVLVQICYALLALIVTRLLVLWPRYFPGPRFDRGGRACRTERLDSRCLISNRLAASGQSPNTKYHYEERPKQLSEITQRHVARPGRQR